MKNVPFFLGILIALCVLGSCSTEELDKFSDPCNDGLQNRSESGVDCGGICNPCPTAFESQHYFQGTIGQEAVFFEESEDIRLTGTSTHHSNPASCILETASSFHHLYNDPVHPNVKLTFHNLFTGSGPCTDHDIRRFFPSLIYEGKWPLYINGTQEGLPSVSVEYTDETGNIWYSNEGIQDHGLVLEIRNSEPTQGPLYPTQLLQRVIGRFSCRVYDYHGNDQMILDAEFLYDFAYAN